MLATSIRQPSSPSRSQRRVTSNIRRRSSRSAQLSFGSERTPSQVA
jgi:hypothetical protein